MATVSPSFAQIPHFGFAPHPSLSQWPHFGTTSHASPSAYPSGTMFFGATHSHSHSHSVSSSNRSPFRGAQHVRRDSMSSNSSGSTPSPRSGAQVGVDDREELATDAYMDHHLCHNRDDPENLFDFVLLPGTVNARPGMKTAAPETIPCKYGNSCFRKDCRFGHSSTLYTGPASNSNTNSIASSHGNSYTPNRSGGSKSPASTRPTSPLSEPASPPRLPARHEARLPVLTVA